MNTNEIVKALRDTDFHQDCDYCEHSDLCKDKDCVILQAADEIGRLQKELDAATKCIGDTETYLEMGSGGFAYNTIKKWRGRESEVK